MTRLLPVSEALNRMLKGVRLLESISVALGDASGRVLAEDLAATRTQPPFPASAMDGYAVRATDIIKTPCRLSVIGESAAGHGFRGTVGVGEAVRIFTGAPVPEGADTIVIQENAQRVGTDSVHISQSESQGRYVRPAGLDFKELDSLLEEGTVMSASALSLAAAMNHARISVRRQPKVSIISSGDELVMPGSSLKQDQIISSNEFGVAALVEQTGAEATRLGIAEDSLSSIEEKLSQSGCSEADLVITLGGASVGEHDLIKQALEGHGVTMDFWKIAMRPGKPVMFGQSTKNGRTTFYLGLPGNPVSSLVCTLIFAVPMIKKMLGLSTDQFTESAILGEDLSANDQREEYMRAQIKDTPEGLRVFPFQSQDSSILSLLHQADCLLIRPAHAPAAQQGDACSIIKI